MAQRLDFEINVELETGLITGHAGVPGLIESFRQTGTAAVIDREIKLKSRQRGLSASEMAESPLAMWAAGGERAEDLGQFRQDQALALLLGTNYRQRRPRAISWRSSMSRIYPCCMTAKPACPPRRRRCCCTRRSPALSLPRTRFALIRPRISRGLRTLISRIRKGEADPDIRPVVE